MEEGTGSEGGWEEEGKGGMTLRRTTPRSESSTFLCRLYNVTSSLVEIY